MIGNKINFGRNQWLILDKRDDKVLVLSEKVLMQKPYHDGFKDYMAWEYALHYPENNWEFHEHSSQYHL